MFLPLIMLPSYDELHATLRSRVDDQASFTFVTPGGEITFKAPVDGQRRLRYLVVGTDEEGLSDQDFALWAFQLDVDGESTAPLRRRVSCFMMREFARI
jgi:hypothetical protein